MKAIFRYSLAALGTILLSLSGLIGPISGAAASGNAQANPLPANMLDKEWDLKTYESAKVAPRDVSEFGSTIMFGSDGSVSGTSGCNSFSGQYRTGPDQAITFGPLATTRVACSGAIGIWEGTYFEALGSVASYTLNDSQLHLTFDNGQGALTYEAKGGTPVTPPVEPVGGTEQILAGTAWVLTEYAVQRSAPVPAVGDQHPTLVFGNNGQVSGDNGCNNYNGPYTQNGDQLNIGPLITTLRACLIPSISQQEQTMMQVLGGQPVFTWEGNRLTLSAPAGMLAFNGADSQNTGARNAGNTTPGMPKTGGSDPISGLLLLLLALASLGIGLGLRTLSILKHATRKQ